MLSFEESYVGQVRKLVGDRKLLTPGARGIIRDDRGRILFIRRRDNDQWGLPAGLMELDETVYDALCREVREERYKCNSGHRVSLCPNGKGDIGWK